MSTQYKAYVEVDAAFSTEGGLEPKAIIWEDGRRFEITRVTDMRAAPAEIAGGRGDRYTIVLNGQTRYLFFEHATDTESGVQGRWFVELRPDGPNERSGAP